MWAYWLLFLVPAGIAFSPIKGDKNVQYMMWVIVGLLGILLIGLRYQVGGDWTTYLGTLQDSQIGSVSEMRNLTAGYLYVLLNRLAIQMGLGISQGIYFINLICGAITMVGLIKYCQKQPMPWIALTVAVPYLICIVAMGYTRQAVALGFLLWGLSVLRIGSEGKFIGLIFLGTLFHLSLILTLPLVFFSGRKYYWWQYLLCGLFIFFGLFFLLSTTGLIDVYQIIIEYYITTTKGSFAGALIRVCMNVVPLFAAFFFWDKIKKISPDYTIIKWMAIAAFLTIPLLSFATTLVDRFALYLIPLQLALWPRLIAVQKTMLMRSTWASMILAYYGLVLFVWFNFAIHAPHWLPYRMFPFTSETIYPPLYPFY